MAVADKVSTVLTWSLQLRYQMLDRMKQDCEYFLGHGNRVTKYLWAGNVHRCPEAGNADVLLRHERRVR